MTQDSIEEILNEHLSLHPEIAENLKINTESFFELMSAVFAYYASQKEGSKRYHYWAIAKLTNNDFRFIFGQIFFVANRLISRFKHQTNPSKEILGVGDEIDVEEEKKKKKKISGFQVDFHPLRLEEKIKFQKNKYFPLIALIKKKLILAKAYTFPEITDIQKKTDSEEFIKWGMRELVSREIPFDIDTEVAPRREIKASIASNNYRFID